MSEPLILATAAELRAIFGRAIAALDAVYAREDRGYDLEQSRRDDQQIRAVIEAFRFACVAAGHLGDGSLLPLMIQAIDLVDRYEPRAEDHPTVLGEGLSLLLQKGVAADDGVRELAAHEDARIRAAVAKGLRPRGPAEVALLEALVKDPIAEVRIAAKQNLSTVRDVAWWIGKFQSDPLARLSAAEAERLKPELEGLSAMLDQPRYAIYKKEDEIVELCSALPDELCVEVAEGILGANDPYRVQFPALGTLMLGRAGGVEAFIRLCGLWNSYGSAYLLGGGATTMVAALPDDERLAVCLRLAAVAAALSPEERSKQIGSAGRILAETAGHAYPPGADLSPLLDLALAMPNIREKYAIDWVAAGLGEAFSSERADPGPILARALGARLAGYPDGWKAIQRDIDKLLERAPASALHPVAEQALAADDDKVAKWGIEQLLGPAHDAERDPPRLEIVARFLAHPRYRKLLLDSTEVAPLAAPLLRAELRAGKLGFAEAAEAVDLAGKLWGGVARPPFIRRRSYDDDGPEEPEVRAQREAREAAHDCLGPPELRGPPTDEEWSILRALRAATPRAELKQRLFVPMPPGPWAAEDRAILDPLVAAFRAGEDKEIVEIAFALTLKPVAELFPLFEELLARSDKGLRGYVTTCRRDAASELGIALPLDEGGEDASDAGDASDAEDDASDAEEDAGDVEWMDEPED